MAYPQLAFKHTTLPATSLVGRRREVVASNTLKYQLKVLKETGRYEAFNLKWQTTYEDPPEVWPVPNHLFWDSDVGKWIEGACYFLQQQSMPEMDAAVKELVEMIRHAQQEDGYLNIHYQVVEPGKRFTNLKHMHELYNLGHLIEGALAHQDLYGNDLFLAPMLKYVDLLCHTFGPESSGRIPGYPGHPELELALLRLYDRTKNVKHLELAKFFILERGNPHGCEGQHYFDVEARRRGDDESRRPAYYPEPRSLWYHQAHALIKDQQSVEGHCVRAMYLLTAVADLIKIEGSNEENDELLTAALRLWDNMVSKKMYITGGIGAIKQWEGFGVDYYLPQSTDEGGCYAETCAAIGVMMLADRLLRIRREARFGDVMELCLYNSVLTAMSHDGHAFTYVNQLASSETDASKREDWFTVACCPPNVLRLLGQIGGYIWDADISNSRKAINIVVHLYITSTATFEVAGEKVTISQESSWPWVGKIDFDVKSDVETSVTFRLPGWAADYELSPPCLDVIDAEGYISIPAQYIKKNPRFTLNIPLVPRWVTQTRTAGKGVMNLMRGPVVYCVEDVDNPWVTDHFRNTSVDTLAKLRAKHIVDQKTGDEYVAMTLIDGAYDTPEMSSSDMPFVDIDGPRTGPRLLPELTFVPYYFRANRGGQGEMRVGLNHASQSACQVKHREARI